MTLPLQLLPPSSLDLSLVVVVFVGTLLLWRLAEAFGWSFSGLVVPGYLGSVIALSPTAGATIAAEALLTALIVRLVSDTLARSDAWTPFFGRERFLLVVMVSVLVRQHAETWGIAAVLDLLPGLRDKLGVDPTSAHSIGLVLVPLTANALGREGFVRSIPSVALPVFGTWWILDRVLLGWTNVSLGVMALVYEDLSLDFLGSAKAYVVLLTGAVIASRVNASYAWSAGGILIPALLGLSWLEPERLAATLVEALGLAAVFKVGTALPGVRSVNLEGHRKLMGLFTLAVTWRLLFTWAASKGAPVSPDRALGTGFLLSSLIALKLLQRKSVGAVMFPLVGTSLAAFVGGSALAWALESVLPAAPIAPLPGVVPSTRLLASIPGAAAMAQVRVRLEPTRAPAVAPSTEALDAWRALWTALPTAADPGALTLPPGLTWLRRGEGGWWLLGEPEGAPSLGWGMAVVRPAAQGPWLGVAHPAGDDGAKAAAACVAVDCHGIVFAGVDADGDSGPAWTALTEVLTVQPPLDRGPPPWTALPEGEPSLVTWERTERERALAGWEPSRAEQTWITEQLVPALDRAVRDPLLLPAAIHAASVVGMKVQKHADGLLLVPEQAGASLWLGAAGAPIVIEVPHALREAGTGRIAALAVGTLHARALVLDTSNPGSPAMAHALHLGLRRLIDHQPGAVSLTVRGLGLERAAAFPEPTAAGVGAPVFGEPPADALAITQALGLSSVRWAADAPGEEDLSGSRLATVQADLQLGGSTPLVLWFAPAARDAHKGWDPELTERWLGGAGLHTRLAALDALPRAPGRPLSPSAVDALVALAERARAQRNILLVRALAADARRQGATLTVGVDATSELAFFDLAAGNSAVRVPLVDGPLRRVDVVAGDARDAAEQIGHALASGPALVVLRGGAP